MRRCGLKNKVARAETTVLEYALFRKGSHALIPCDVKVFKSR